MVVTLTAGNIILAFTLVGAVVGLVVYFAKAVRWFDRQEHQDKKIKKLDEKHNNDMGIIMSELEIHTRSLLACLKGLQEKGCNGPVTNAIEELEVHLNKEAHKQ